MNSCSVAVLFFALAFASVPPLASQPMPSGTAAADAAGPPATPEDKTRAVNRLLDAAFEAYVEDDFEKAIQMFQKVLEINPTEEAALKGIKQCRKRLENKRKKIFESEAENMSQTRKLFRSEKWLDAMDLLDKVLVRAPNYSDALNLKNDFSVYFENKTTKSGSGPGERLLFQGMIHYLNKRYDKAAEIWKEAAGQSKENFKLGIYIERAEHRFMESDRYQTLVLGKKKAQDLFDAGSYTEAAEQWKKILEIDSANDEAQRGLKDALEMMDRADKKNRIGELYDHGLSLYNEGKWADSLKDWKSIIAMDPANEVANDYAARIQAKLSGGSKPAPPSKPEGVQISSAAKQASPKPQAIVKKDAYAAGISLYESGKLEAAAKFFAKKTQKNPADSDAAAWLKKITDEQNQKAEQRYNQGLVAYSEGKVSDAIKEWEEALKILPSHLPTLRVLSKVGKTPAPQEPK